MLENRVENRLKLVVKKAGGKALKFIPDYEAGMPDRLVLLPGGKMIWVETKAPGEKARALQFRKHRELRALGFKVLVLDTYAAVDDFEKEYLK